MTRWLTVVTLCLSSLALAQPRPPNAPPPPNAPQPPQPPPMPMMGFGGGPMMGGPAGIPPGLAQKAGISPEVQKKVRDMSFDANDQLIQLEADLKRAQLDLERTLSGATVDEAAVMNKLEVVSRAELAVRKNRMGLLVRIRKAVGNEAWEKLQAEMPGPGPGPMMMGMPGGGMRREVRIIRGPNGEETMDVRNE